MRDSQLHCHHCGKNFDHLLMIQCYLLPLPFFFLVFGTYPYKNYSSAFWCLRLLCSSSSSLALALEEWDRFLVPSSLSILGLSEVFIASMTFLEIWLPSVVICCPRASQAVPKWILNWWFSGLTYFQRFIVMTISADHDQYLKS